MINDASFKEYPANKPKVSGYYYAYYRHPSDEYFYKAIYYRVETDEWVAWNKVYDPNVISYIEETRADFYCPCLELVEKLIKD
ncbi:hypothetical protein [Synechococcus phage BUCT-ZZ01]|nr:hypothetical protein [Synechococcus phage BUCT-ZZ01]